MRPVDPKMHWNNEPTIIAPCSSLIISRNFCSKHTKVYHKISKKTNYFIFAKAYMLSEVPKVL